MCTNDPDYLLYVLDCLMLEIIDFDLNIFSLTSAEAIKEESVEAKDRKQHSDIAIDPELMELLHKGLDGDEQIAVHEFFLALAACNTVIPILNQSSSSSSGGCEINDDVQAIDYQGESPDEQALVAAARAYGYTLFERTSGHVVIDVNGEKLR